MSEHDWTPDDVAIWWNVSKRTGLKSPTCFTLLAVSDAAAISDYNLMHLMSHKTRTCARCNVFGFRIEWLGENGLLGRFA